MGGAPKRAGRWDARRKRCSVCGRSGHDRRTCGRAEARNGGRPFDPWRGLEWEEHAEARRIVAENPDGMTLEEVGKVLGVTRERVRQIEAAALEKLRTGTGLAEAVTVDDRTVALVPCRDCDAWFARRGRQKVCDDCASPKPRRRRPPKAPPPEVRRLPPPAEVLVAADPEPPSTPPPAFFLTIEIEIDLGGW